MDTALSILHDVLLAISITSFIVFLNMVIWFFNGRNDLLERIAILETKVMVIEIRQGGK